MVTSSDSWSSLGAVSPRELIDARLALHYAAQPMAAAAYALLPMQEDHGHSNLLWSEMRDGFVGRVLPRKHRCFLDVVALRTGLLGPEGAEIAAVELAGKTLDSVFAELADALRGAGEDVPPEGLVLPPYDLPEAPVAGGAPFLSPDVPGLEELARWFRNGARALTELAGSHLGGAEVRGWPHHFDMAALLTVDSEGSEGGRSVNAGLSPGDGTYAEPYFYVSPWPYPSAGDLAVLSGGARWHTEGFTAAVLLGSDLIAAGGGDAQEENVRLALHSSVSACLALLGA